MTHLEDALSYARGGWPVFPVGKDKAPVTKHGFQDATTHEGLIRELWRQHSGANVALGIPEGLVVLDFDPRNGAPPVNSFRWEEEPLRCETPSGGSHLYFRVDPDAELAGKWMAGVDVKAGGKGYVLLPWSENEDGKAYYWYRGEQPDDFEDLTVYPHIIPQLPEWVLGAITKRQTVWNGLGGHVGETVEPTFSFELGTKYGLFGLQQQLGLLGMAENGHRNETLNRVGYRVGQYVAGGEVKEAALFEVARVAEWLGLERDEISATLQSAYEAGLRKPWTR